MSDNPTEPKNIAGTPVSTVNPQLNPMLKTIDDPIIQRASVDILLGKNTSQILDFVKKHLAELQGLMTNPTVTDHAKLERHLQETQRFIDQWIPR